MSYAFSVSRRGLRTAAALGAAALGLLVTTACEKPTPLMTVTVGSDTVTTEAACYADGEALKQSSFKKCLNEKADESIEVGYGDKIRIGVEPETADKGWTLLVNGRRALPEPIDTTYHSFPGDVFFQRSAQPRSGAGGGADEAKVSVVAMGDGKVYGIWHVKAERES